MLDNSGPEPEVSHFGQIYFDHNIIIGRLILAKNLKNDTGAVIYMVDDFTKDPAAINPNLVAKLANDSNFHSLILPFFQTELASHFDNGEPATLTLRQYPSYIPVLAWRSELSSD